MEVHNKAQCMCRCSRLVEISSLIVLKPRRNPASSENGRVSVRPSNAGNPACVGVKLRPSVINGNRTRNSRGPI